MSKKKVLILGATGRIGPSLMEEYFKKYKKDYELILGYHKSKPEYDLESREISLTDIEKLKKAMIGIDVVVNLAANSDEKSEFSEIVQPNIIGAYNVFQAALDAKVKRVVFASSVHAIRGYEFGKEVRHDDVPKPMNYYGASKVFGEALCHVFAQKGLSCLAIRIGAYLPDNERKVVCYAREYYDYVISQRDFAQLLSKCILAPEKIKFGILSGISNNKNKYMDLKFTKELVGYEPEDDFYEICEEIKNRGGKNILEGSRKNLEKSAAKYLHDKIKETLERKNSAVLGIVGGRSVQGILENLSEKKLDWKNIHIFMADERFIPITDEESNFYVVKKSLKHGIFHPFDYKKNISEYQKEFDKFGGKFDIVVLSSGEDGHTASLFPNHESIKNSSESFIKVDNSPKPPKDRMSASRKLISTAKHAVLIFFGEGKKDAYEKFADEKIGVEKCPTKIFNEIEDGIVLKDF